LQAAFPAGKSGDHVIIYASLYRSVENGNVVVNPLGLAKRAEAMASTLAQFGCNAYLWPPLTMSQGGAADNADGYGKARDLDVGQFGQPTRWGSAQDVQAANRAFHQHGMMVLEDAVMHQYAGNLPIFERGSDGNTNKTLFPKMPSCFVPQVRVDDVFDSDGNQAFGQMVSYQHSTPAGYMLQGAIQALKWRRDRLGLDGGRYDDTKGANVSVVSQMINSVGGWWFGECFTGDPGELDRWVSESGGICTLDFTLHYALKPACEGTNSLRALPGNGFYARNAAHAVLFVDSADTDINSGDNIRWNKLWAYLLILTLPAAAALIYAGDYEKYGLGQWINNLMWISATFAFGNLAWQHVEDDVIVWSRDGNGGEVGWSGGLLCAFSRLPLASWSAWVRTPFAPNTHLQDYTGHRPDLWTNADGWVQLTLGPNVNGSAQNYVCYAPAGVNHGFPIKPRSEHISGSLTDFSSITVRHS
jgi:alpha-amylase